MAAGIFFRNVLETILRRKHSILGAISGAISGLVAITPAAGYINPKYAIVLGGTASVICYFGIQFKRYFGLDDALDSFGLHGIAGIIGSLLVGIFAAAQFGGTGLPNNRTVYDQVAIQILCITTICLWSALITFIILKILDKTIGIRVQLQSEEAGLDIAAHGEHGYNQ